MFSPTVATSFVVLLGNPLGHSISPPMHNRAYEKLGLDYCYFPLETTKEDLATIIAALKKMRVAGANVTIPHKLNVMAHLEHLDPLASTIGAVNTIRFHDGAATGYNTDGLGFTLSLKKEGGTEITGERVLLFGCGGAARAIAMTLVQQGVTELVLCNRTFERAETLATEINTRLRHCAVAVSGPEALAAAAKRCRVIVNATSLGMHPHPEHCPLDPTLLAPHHLVADIVNNPRQTKLLKAARQCGAKTVDGLGMLVYQGAEAFRLFTGVEPPLEVMFAEVEKQMG